MVLLIYSIIHNNRVITIITLLVLQRLIDSIIMEFLIIIYENS